MMQSRAFQETFSAYVSVLARRCAPEGLRPSTPLSLRRACMRLGASQRELRPLRTSSGLRPPEALQSPWLPKARGGLEGRSLSKRRANRVLGAGESGVEGRSPSAAQQRAKANAWANYVLGNGGELAFSTFRCCGGVHEWQHGVPPFLAVGDDPFDGAQGVVAGADGGW